MKVPVEIDHAEFQIYGGGITTRVDVDIEGDRVKMTTYYSGENNYGVEESFTISLEKGKVVLIRTKIVPATDENGDIKWGADRIVTDSREVLKDFTVGK